MSIKIEAIGTALICTNTVGGVRIISEPSKDTWYKETDLQNGRISFYDTGGTKGELYRTENFPLINLSDSVDGSLVAFTESTFRTFCTDNLGKSSPTADGGLTNVVQINSASDFPAAVGGVRELVPTPGDSITYVIAAVNIDIGSDRFTITGGDIVIIGSHRSASTITTTNATTMFTCVDSAFFPEFIGFDCVNALVVSFSTPVETFKSFVCDNVIIRNCTSIFTIDGAFTTSLRTLTVIATSVGGILWTGTDSSQINMSNCLALDWTGTLFDLGTATFDIISITSGNRFVSPSGTTSLSGVGSSANLTTDGRGLVENNLFNGDGTPISGIDTHDLKWEFKGNIFTDGTTLNTRQIADAFLTSSQTATIGTIGVYVAIGGANWGSDLSDRFTVSTAGLATYIGISNIEVDIMAFSTIEKVGGGTDKICSKIAINGTVADKTIGCTENATPTGVSSVGLFTLSTGDTIQTFVGNLDSTSNVIVSESTLVIQGE